MALNLLVSSETSNQKVQKLHELGIRLFGDTLEVLKELPACQAQSIKAIGTSQPKILLQSSTDLRGIAKRLREIGYQQFMPQVVFPFARLLLASMDYEVEGKQYFLSTSPLKNNVYYFVVTFMKIQGDLRVCINVCPGVYKLPIDGEIIVPEA